MTHVRLALLALATITVVAVPAFAHHGWSSKTWVVTLAPPSRMENRGLPSSMLAPGNKATVVGYPSRSDPSEMRAERITIAGKTVELR